MLVPALKPFALHRAVAAETQSGAPFEAGEHRRVAVKVIDDRGNELMVVKSLDEAE